MDTVNTDRGTQADDHETKMAALKLKAQAAGVQVDTAARGAIDTIQADLDDVAARIAHATGDTRNELRAREGQLRATLDLALMGLRSTAADASLDVADDALHNK